MTKTINRWAAANFSGYDIWNGYNDAITQLLQAVKINTMTYGKFFYVTAHYPPKQPGSQVKRYVTTKGKEHTNIIEESFATVVEAKLEDRAFWFDCDVFDNSSTTKTKLIEGGFKFVRKSLDDLEQILTGKKSVENIGENNG
jgi:hypothetical protein